MDRAKQFAQLVEPWISLSPDGSPQPLDPKACPRIAQTLLGRGTHTVDTIRVDQRGPCWIVLGPLLSHWDTTLFRRVPMIIRDCGHTPRTTGCTQCAEKRQLHKQLGLALDVLMSSSEVAALFDSWPGCHGRSERGGAYVEIAHCALCSSRRRIPLGGDLLQAYAGVRDSLSAFELSRLRSGTGIYHLSEHLFLFIREIEGWRLSIVPNVRWLTLEEPVPHDLVATLARHALALLP